MNFQLAIVFVTGVLLGKFANWAVYRCAWLKWEIGPWCKPPKGCDRNWHHWLPVVGWFLMRGEGGKDDHHSPGFWIRPLMLELSLGIGLAWLYQWELSGALLPGPLQPLASHFTPMLQAQFAAHAILFAFLVAASFTDFDERTIPDSITIPGTLIALVLGTFVPLVRLPEIVDSDLSVLALTSPNPWSAELNGTRGLGIAVLCFGAWCLALLPMICTMRFGLWRGIQLLVASLIKSRRRTARTISLRRVTHAIIAMQWLGWIWICGVWWLGSTAQWQSLLSQLVGMAFGGAMVWSIRIIGFIALRKEAMGFGDVTLMAMIGAFVGWQPCLLIFGLAPASAIIVAVLQFIFTRDNEIAFGPYLALGTLISVVLWRRLWFDYARDFFAIGGGMFVPGVCAVCLFLMLGMLWMIRLFKELVLGMEDDGENGALPEPEA